MRLLSTKLLSANFKDRLIQHGFSLIEYPFIKIIPLVHNTTELQDHIIMTSQNAVQLAFNDLTLKPKLEGKNYFCVGEKTKALLEEKGQKVIEMSQNASILASFILKNYKNDSFSFFCGKQKRPEIETNLSSKAIPLNIHEMYETLYAPKVIETEFDGVLFFSPSAVESYFKMNSWKQEMQGFCIGSTTASSLSKYTLDYSIAKAPNENQLLLSIHHYYTHHYAQK